MRIVQTGLAVLALVLCSGAHAELRTWTLVTGRNVEAEYVKTVIDTVWLKSPSGDLYKIPEKQLSEEDRLYVEWFNPPELKIEFWDKSEHKLGYYKGTPHFDWVISPSMTEHSFRARVKQVDRKPYHHELTVTYYAIGRQRLDRDKYIFLEKKTGRFTPAEQPEIELTGAVFKMLKYDWDNQPRGRDFAFYLVLVTDEHGEIIGHRESQDWLFEHRERLDELPARAFMDTTCKRVHPTGPKPQY